MGASRIRYKYVIRGFRGEKLVVISGTDSKRQRDVDLAELREKLVKGEIDAIEITSYVPPRGVTRITE